jgi:hypothetical protein
LYSWNDVFYAFLKNWFQKTLVFAVFMRILLKLLKKSRWTHFLIEFFLKSVFSSYINALFLQFNMKIWFQPPYERAFCSFPPQKLLSESRWTHFFIEFFWKSVFSTLVNALFLRFCMKICFQPPYEHAFCSFPPQKLLSESQWTHFFIEFFLKSVFSTLVNALFLRFCIKICFQPPYEHAFCSFPPQKLLSESQWTHFFIEFFLKSVFSTFVNALFPQFRMKICFQPPYERTFSSTPPQKLLSESQWTHFFYRILLKICFQHAREHTFYSNPSKKLFSAHNECFFPNRLFQHIFTSSLSTTVHTSLLPQ